MNADIKKYFVALLPDADIQEEITAVKNYLAEQYGTRAALKAPPHITLHMPFDWPEQQEEQLISALQNFAEQQVPFPVLIQDYGAFQPRVVFVDVVKSAYLENINKQLVAYLNTELGIKAYNKNKDRPFNPHITIAFRDLKPATFRKIWEAFRHKNIEYDFQASHITLLKHNGKSWDIYRHFPMERNDKQGNAR